MVSLPHKESKRVSLFRVLYQSDLSEVSATETSRAHTSRTSLLQLVAAVAMMKRIFTVQGVDCASGRNRARFIWSKHTFPMKNPAAKESDPRCLYMERAAIFNAT